MQIHKDLTNDDIYKIFYKEPEVYNRSIWAPALYIQADGTLLDLTDILLVSKMGRLKYTPSFMSSPYRRALRPHQMLNPVPQHCPDYRVARFYFDGKYRSLRIHRLVLSTFDYAGWFKGAEAHHIDHNTKNNRLDNLQWVSRDENRRLAKMHRDAKRAVGI